MANPVKAVQGAMKRSSTLVQNEGKQVRKGVDKVFSRLSGAVLNTPGGKLLKKKGGFGYLKGNPFSLKGTYGK